MADVKKLNIGILHNTYTQKGGEDHVAESEYQLLKANGYNVFFLLFNNPGGSLKQLLIYLVSPFNVVSFIKCCRWLKRNRIDVLHVHNWFFAASPAVFWAARLCRVPVVATIHNYRMLCPSGTLIYNGNLYLSGLHNDFNPDAIKKGVYRNSRLLTAILAFTLWFNKRLGTWNIAKRYIVLTAHARELIAGSHLSSLSSKLVVKPNFVSAGTAVNRGGNSSFLFAGRLSEEKGIRLLLEAFKGSAHQLTVIGDGPLKGEVEEFVKNNSNVRYLGFQNKASIEEELSRCSALIFPSIWYETFGLILIEAFAASTPVIASYYGSASVIVKDGYNGLHFEKAEAASLAAKLNEWAVLNEDVKAQYRSNAYSSYLQQYTPEKNLEKLAAVYQEAVQQQ